MIKNKILTEGQYLQNLLLLSKVKRGRNYGWLCRCKCGKEIFVEPSKLKNGQKGCKACSQIPLRKTAKPGDIFGNLTVIDIFNKDSDKFKPICKAKCNCGTIKNISLYSIRYGKAKSCGCLSKRKGKDCKQFKGYEEIYGETWYQIKCNALSRNLDFLVDIKYAWRVFIEQDRKCRLSGKFIEFNNCAGGEKTASLDRIDSSKGYISGNIQWVHKDINKMKWDFVQEEFINYCKLIAEHNK